MHVAAATQLTRLGHAMHGRHYYVEFGGGLGDIFQQIYAHGAYSALRSLEADDRATVTLITHNPFASELFANHPRRAQIDVRVPGYWLPDDDVPNRRRLALPPFSTEAYATGPAPQSGPITFYPSPEDDGVLAEVSGEAGRRERPIVVFAASGGEPHKSLPRALVERIAADVAEAGCLPVFVGRSYERNFREELKGFSGAGVELVDRLTVPGTARLVQQAAGVVCCHSSISMLAWMERKPVLLLYPESTYETFIQPRTLWALGVDYPETVHGRFDEYDDEMRGRFLMRVEGAARRPLKRTGAREGRLDVRDFLRTLPVTRNPATGYDYTEADWFNVWNGYPFYVRAVEEIRPASVLEIGTFLGFGLAAFAYGCETIERLTSLDNESYIPGSQQACAANLSFFRGETRLVGSLEEARGEYDLIHVDADHTFAGALHDMAFAWGLGPRVMLVDDYAFLEEVRQAVGAFAAHHRLPFKVWNSYRGWAVFARPETLASLPDAL